jgi:hypothetical protein
MKPTGEQQLKLLHYGYYRPDGLEPDDALNLSKLGYDHQYHRNACRRYQEFFKQAIAPQVYSVHGREFILDDEIGPITAFELSKPRCGCPDIPEAGAEEANWPESCRMHLTASYQPGMTLPGLNNADIERGVLQALKNVIDDFEIRITLDQASYPNTNVNCKPARLGGNVLADQYLAINRCDFTSNGRMDSDRNWEYWYFVTVRSHEDGHAWGMPHNGDPSALLYPSINRASVARRGKMNDTDKATMRQLGYKPRVGEPPEPPEPPTSGAIVGEIQYTKTPLVLRVMQVGDWDDGEYIFTGARK